MLDHVRLRSFAEVAERKTVVAAAVALGYTPPAVSQHLAKLEAELGVALFDRAGGRLVLTSAGRKLLPIALEMIDLGDRAKSCVTQPSSRPRFVIAGFASAISTVVVPRLAEIRESMDLEIVEAEDAEAIRDLTLGSVDVVLMQEYDQSAIERNPRFEYVPIIRDELKLVLPSGQSSSIGISDLADAPWLLNGSATRCAEATQELLAANGIQPNVQGTISDNTTLLNLVSAGHGATIVPSSVLDDHHDVVVSNERIGVHRTILGVVRTAVAADVKPLLDLLLQDRSDTKR